jgi:ribosomal protein S21
MTLNVEITKGRNENSGNVIRKFSQRIRGAGIVQRVRNRRYWSRATSKTVKKKQALRRITRNAEYMRLFKEGKVPDRTQGRYRR